MVAALLPFAAFAQAPQLKKVKVPMLTPLPVVMPFSDEAQGKNPQQLFLAQDLIIENVVVLKAGTPVPFELRGTAPELNARSGTLDVGVNDVIRTEAGDELPIGGGRMVSPPDFDWGHCWNPYCAAAEGLSKVVPGRSARFGRALLFNLYVQKDREVSGSELQKAQGGTSSASGRIHLYSSYKTSVALDGKFLGKLRKDSYSCLALARGTHTLKIDNTTLEFSLQGGEERYFKIIVEGADYIFHETSGYQFDSALTLISLKTNLRADCFAPLTH